MGTTSCRMGITPRQWLVRIRGALRPQELCGAPPLPPERNIHNVPPYDPHQWIVSGTRADLSRLRNPSRPFKKTP